MSNTVTRSQARTWTIGAQIASGLCVLGAVALGVIGLPEPTPGAALEQAKSSLNARLPGPAGEDPATDGELPTESADVDTMGLAQRLALVDNAPTPVITPPEEPVEGVDPPQPGPVNAEIVKRVRYIGFINDPDTRHAFIRIDGKQRIVPLGGIAAAGDDQFPDLTLERVTPQLIVLTDGETRASVNLANRSGQSVTMIDGGEVNSASSENENGSLLTAEDEEMIASLPPRQQPGARRRLERERRGLPPEVVRPRPQPQATVRGSISRDGEQPVRRLREDRQD